MAHKLFTVKALRRLTLNGKKSLNYENVGRAEPDFRPVIKIYNPVGRHIWLFTELAADGDTLFGLCYHGDNHPGLGTMSKLQLTTTRVTPAGRNRDPVPLMRDRYFSTKHPLTVWLEAAQRAGCITDDDMALNYAAAKLERPPRLKEIAAIVPHRA